ncbi:glucuronyl hydrolase [Pseudomonas sp.]|uniref:glucuronyl hydrolase n=1 Tax=Pseudomonas sp. TaxID=306 RepID=UPI003A983441
MSELMALQRTAAIDALLLRLEVIEHLCGEDFPLYSPGLEDRWTVSRGGSWLGGFWAGLWWLRARVSGASADRHKAARISQRLTGKMAAPTINRSMIFWYGLAPGALWFDDVPCRLMLDQAGAALAISFSRTLGCIPLGRDMGGGPQGDQRIVIDTLAPALRLLDRHPLDSVRELAAQHLQGTLAACGTWRGAYCASVQYCQQRVVVQEQAGCWSRGQAWAMLGLAQAAGLYGQPFTDLAQRACDYWLETRREALPANHLQHPDAGDDPCAAVIAALAMLGLDSLPGQSMPWREHAEGLLAAVVHSQHVELGGATPGLFGGMRYRTGEGDVLVESACSSFFLLLALLVLDGRINALDC